MHTAPERLKDDKSERPQLTRLESLRKAWAPEWAGWVSESTVEALRAEYMPDMPPLRDGGYLVQYLLEIGPVMSGTMGSGPLTFGEVDAWCNRTGVNLTPWESRFLCRLSREYLYEQHCAEKHNAQAPWQPIDYESDLSDVAKPMRSKWLEE